MRAEGGLSTVFSDAIESLASAIEVREIGTLRTAGPRPVAASREKVRAVAQLGRAPASGAGGPGFKSLQPDVSHPRQGREEWPLLDMNESENPAANHLL